MQNGAVPLAEQTPSKDSEDLFNTLAEYYMQGREGDTAASEEFYRLRKTLTDNTQKEAFTTYLLNYCKYHKEKMKVAEDPNNSDIINTTRKTMR